MDRETAKKAAAIMQAYADGKPVEFFSETNGRWQDIISPAFDWCSNKYRIKEMPEYREFISADECAVELQKHPLVGYLQRRGTEAFFAIKSIYHNGVEIGDKAVSFPILLADYEFADGTPAGVKE